jgi:hypothetical protein
MTNQFDQIYLEQETIDDSRPEHMLNRGDEMGIVLKHIGLPSTLDCTIPMDKLQPIPFDPIAEQLLGGGQVGLLAWKGVKQALADSVAGFPIDEAFILSPIKKGKFEKVGILSIGDHLYIVTYPLISYGSRGIRAAIMFQESIAAMERTHDLVPITPRIYWGSDRFAISELIGDGFEETNFSYNQDGFQPDRCADTSYFMQFLTYNDILIEVNRYIQELPPDLCALLNVYYLAKIIALRIIMTLATLERRNAFITGLMPRCADIGAGDFIGRFNKQHQFEPKAIAFRGGTVEVPSLDDLIVAILRERITILKASSHMHTRTSKLIPSFDRRDEWVTSLAAWSLKLLYDECLRLGRLDYCELLTLFVDDNCCRFGLDDALKLSRSPFTPEALECVAPYINHLLDR